MLRKIRSNLRCVAALVADPDAWGIQAASLGQIVNTNSPASVGVGARATGLSGYGVNRSTGDIGPMQGFQGIPLPVANPGVYNVGMQAGPSDQPGFPNTGLAGGSTGWLDLAKSNNLGWGA